MPILTAALTHGYPVLQVEVDVPLSLRQAARMAGLNLPSPRTEPAVVDTGAGFTCVDPQVIQALGLSPIGTNNVQTPHTAAGSQAADVYLICLTIPHQAGNLFLPVMPVYELPIAHLGHRLLIGNDVLDLCEFYRDGPNGEFSLEW